MSVRLQPEMKSECSLVDNAFGPEDDNEKVYDSTVRPLIDASLQGGSSYLFAYG